MNGKKDANNDVSTYSIELLKIDFQECFNQMRHYDNLIWQVTAGILSLDAAILVVIFNILDSKKTIKPVLSFLISGIIAIGGLIIGLFTLYFILRTRIYYAKVARYVNEIRKQYLKENPLDIKNQAGLYTNPSLPKIANFKSSQLVPTYILILINTFFSLLGILIVIKDIALSIVISLSIMVFQISFLICFLRRYK